MGVFIHSNIIWIVPIISIILTVVIKISAKPDFLTLDYIDYLDFGFDLSITSIIVNRVGWNRETKQLKLIGVLFPDIIGIILLIVATLYMGGVIK